MLLNYLKIAFRVLTRNKLVSIINIFGLALALSGSLLIAIFIHDELRYDRFHKNADRIYRVTRNYTSPDGSQIMHLGHLAPPFAPLLKNDFPDIIQSARSLGPFNTSMIIEGENESKNLAVENVYAIEASALEIFSIEILSGSNSSLDRPYSLMLSDKAALKYFGHSDVAGVKLKVFDQVMEVTGTFRSFPTQSHWHPDALMSFSTLNDDANFGTEQLRSNWENNSFLTYILVTDEFDPARTEKLFPSFIDKHMPAGGDAVKKSSSTHLFLQPLTSIHLHSHLDSEAETNGNINHIYAMISIGIFLIIIACFNFINLSTARSTERGKEVGLRKVSGAVRGQLIFQYISESTVIALLAMVVAIALALGYLPWLNNFTGKSINIYDYLNFKILIIVIGFVFAIGALAGLYPAFVISGYKPALILKGQSSPTRNGGAIRKALVITQFSISIVIIIATLITHQQLQFLNNKELGYAKDQIITFRYAEEARDHYDVFYQALKQHSAIVNVTRSNRIPTWRLLDTNNVSAEQGNSSVQKTEINMKNVSVDQHFFDTYKIPVVSGKDFPKDMRSNGSFDEKVGNGFILNESACKLLGWSSDEAAGRVLVNGGVKGTITGVVKDFHFESLHERIAPIVFVTYNDYSQVSVLVSASRIKEGIAHIEKAWKQSVTQESFKYEFLNDRYSRLYESEASQQELFFIFAVLAIFIASLGLFGLATFNAIQRSKEVSIRKVLGASVNSILRLLGKETIILVLAANIIAWPIAWYLMKEWLGEFAYHIEMNILTYIGVGLLTMIVTLLTISTQTMKAALTNPATMLRSE